MIRSTIVTLWCVLAALLVAAPSSCYAQCSDAGVCVIGKEHDNSGHSFGLSYNYGSSGKDSTIMIHAIRLEGALHIFENSDVYVGIPYSSQSGSAGSASGVGDLTIVWNQILFRGKGTLRVQGGVKLATGEVNANNLPQAYQSGLGTNDFLFGASYEIDELSIAAAYQISMGRSANRITRLKRGDDLMVRAGYMHRKESWTLGGEVLAIKRLQQSSVLIGTQPETFGELPNSNQLQLNLLGRVSYSLDEHYVLQTEAAIALLKRNTNVDGLKRAFTLSLGLSYML